MAIKSLNELNQEFQLDYQKVDKHFEAEALISSHPADALPFDGDIAQAPKPGQEENNSVINTDTIPQSEANEPAMYAEPQPEINEPAMYAEPQPEINEPAAFAETQADNTSGDVFVVSFEPAPIDVVPLPGSRDSVKIDPVQKNNEASIKEQEKKEKQKAAAIAKAEEQEQKRQRAAEEQEQKRQRAAVAKAEKAAKAEQAAIAAREAKAAKAAKTAKTEKPVAYLDKTFTLPSYTLYAEQGASTTEPQTKNKSAAATSGQAEAGYTEEASDIPPLDKKTLKNRKRFVIAADIVFYVAVSVMLITAFSSSAQSDRPRVIMGFSYFTVSEPSMGEEIPEGSFILVRQVDPATLQIGENITYMKDAITTVTHKIVGIYENYQGSGARGFQTQGVSNTRPDIEIVNEINVVGKVLFSFKSMGVFMTFLGENIYFIFIMFGLFVALSITMRGLFSGNKNQKGKKDSEPAKLAKNRPSDIRSQEA